MKGRAIILRALEPADIDTLYAWENNPSAWKTGDNITPLSRFALEQYVLSSDQDIYVSRQLRLMIDHAETHETIGAIDLFDFDPHHLRAGVGIIIKPESQSRGFASEALSLLTDYAFNTLGLHQLFCSIAPDNAASLKLFLKHGFEITGTRKEWRRAGNTWTDEHFLQLIREHGR